MARRHSYRTVISHPQLNKHRVITASTLIELKIKAENQQIKWDEEWARKTEQENKKAIREAKIRNDQDSQQYANELTIQAEKQQQLLDRIVLDRRIPARLNPNDFKDFSAFPEPEPFLPTIMDIPSEPLLSDAKYNPKPSLFTKLSKKKMTDFNNQNREEYNKDHAMWEQASDRIIATNDKAISEYNIKKEKWDKEKADYTDTQNRENAEIDEVFSKFKYGDAHSIELYYAFLLESIRFPFHFIMQAACEYNPENKRLIVEVNLPTMDVIPKLKAVSYIKTRKEFKETNYAESYLKKKYDNLIYQIVLLCIDYIFSVGSEYNLIDFVVINGRIDTIDKATGRQIHPFVLSLAIDRETFEGINVDCVDPKTWFKSAKGVSATSIAAITPVAPIVNLSHDVSRFIEGYDVVDHLDDSINLAAIDWQDFENLIRELFEKEFSYNGGEVRITQASRDGGVDAVAFDPDPIRGGKIVIQAKRYTNVVNVSAVRDLYGTVLNEGATKGILVTTSNYGTDSYNFAQGKPLALLNGANLLFLLEKHGYHARIDLKEAKQLLKQ